MYSTSTQSDKKSQRAEHKVVIFKKKMGNQQGKQAKRAAPGQTYPFAEPEKKSRTDWTAGWSDSPFTPFCDIRKFHQSTSTAVPEK